MFAVAGYWDGDVWVEGDYHLKSAAGRWDAGAQAWVYDDVTSPCVDAGDPVSDWRGEFWPHGGRINMGAYGGTRWASMSLNPVGSLADVDNDGSVGLGDFGVIARKWGYDADGGGQAALWEAGQGPPYRGDLDRDGVVGLSDLAVFAEGWLIAFSY